MSNYEDDDTTKLFTPPNARKTVTLEVTVDNTPDEFFEGPVYSIFRGDTPLVNEDGDACWETPSELLSALVNFRLAYYEQGIATKVTYPDGFMDLPLK